jgi:uncharacterized membrane protein
MIWLCTIDGILLASFIFLGMIYQSTRTKLDEESLSEIGITRTLLLVTAIVITGIYFLYPVLVKNKLEAHILEWLSLVVRWAHVILGIAWIGASFYFIFLENSLNRTKNLRDELAGNLWAIHGGGFYYIEKYKSAPGVLPEKLHWFKYEAYFTWLTGFLLLILVYYLNAKSFMIDPAVANIDETTAILIGLGSLLGGWFIYDLLCKSPLLAKPKMFGITGFIILVIISYVLSKYLSGRAAFIHVGALLGTIMAGNVFFTIIPSQKALVNAAKNNLPVDASKGKYAGLRSLHNNYITLPVIFVMISNHFPGTFSPAYNWGILAVLTLGSVSVRHYINLHEKGITSSQFLALGAIALFALVFVTAPKSTPPSGPPVKFSEVQPVFQKRCLQCHSTHPTDDVQKVPPNGIVFETPQQISKLRDRIMFRVVQTKTMPQANKTGITEDERTLIGHWIEQGAKID